MIQAIQRAMADIIHYPESGKSLKAKLAQEHGVCPEQIILTNGAAEGFFLAVNALRPKGGMLIEPTFSEYRRAMVAAEVCPSSVVTTAASQFAAPWATVQELWEQDVMLVVCNPNNPTGCLHDQEFMLSLAEHALARKAWLLVDESFQDFLPVQPSIIPGLNEGCIVVRSLTKFFALPGLRLGYMVVPHCLVNSISVQVPGWNVNSLAMAAGVAALEQREWIEASRQLVAEESSFLQEQLGKLRDVRVFPSPANYILLYMAKGAGRADYLLELKILIRSCRNFTGLDANWYRIAVKARQENLKLVAALQSFQEVRL